jgi:DNA adenine methylase
MSKTQVTNPLKYHGGKHYLAKRIVQLMPPHTHYVEPFFGSGAVMFQKDPSGVSEVANDNLSTLTTLWEVLQNESMYERFVRLSEATPFSEQQWKQSEKRLRDEDPVVRAHAFFVLNRLSRQGLMKDFATLSRNRVRRKMNEQVSSWLTAVEGLPQIHERLKRVVILNQDALQVIQRQDGNNTLFYLDPPYVTSTRVATAAYQHEMTDQDHTRLVDVILKCSGKVMLSGYPNAIYERLEYAGWDVFDFQVSKASSSQKSKPKATERIWANFELKSAASGEGRAA